MSTGDKSLATMSIRQHFASTLLGAIVSRKDVYIDSDRQAVAKYAVEFADALISVLEGQDEHEEI